MAYRHTALDPLFVTHFVYVSLEKIPKPYTTTPKLVYAVLWGYSENFD